MAIGKGKKQQIEKSNQIKSNRIPKKRALQKHNLFANKICSV